jgi:hypothetical protein
MCPWLDSGMICGDMALKDTFLVSYAIAYVKDAIGQPYLFLL